MKGVAVLAAFLLFILGCGSSSPGVQGSTTSDACGSCHTSEYTAWKTSPLATSGTSPVFSALSARAGEAWGSEAKARCVSCHEPGYGGDPGIGCVACHSATGNLANRDGLLVVDTTRPISGPFTNPVPTPAHGSEAYGFLESPDLCGTCHQVTGPNLFREPTLSEFESSPAASGGATCATCHMPALASAPVAVGSSVSRARASHAFVGVDPPWGASPDVASAAAEATLALFRSGLVLTVGRSGDGLSVTLTNSAGHAVPTGVAFVRSVWVDVAFANAESKTASVHSVLTLGAQPTHDGAPVALVTEADAVSDHVLEPGASRTVEVAPPAALAPPVSAVVTLRARAVREEVLDALGLAALGAEVPTHEVAVVNLAGLGGRRGTQASPRYSGVWRISVPSLPGQ
jgi:hypothetical protein